MITKKSVIKINYYLDTILFGTSNELKCFKSSPIYLSV